MYKIVLTIPHMLSDLLVLWKDRHVEIKMFAISDLKEMIANHYGKGKKWEIRFLCAVSVKASL